MTKKESKPNRVDLHLDPNLKTIWVDSLYLAKRSDGISCVRLSTGLPEGLHEQLRFITGEKQLREFVNIICANIDYYPGKEEINKFKDS